MTTEFTHKAALVAKSLSQQAGNEEGGAIAGTTDIAGNFAKFIGYGRCFGGVFGVSETVS